MPQKSNKNFASKEGNPRAASTRIDACTAKTMAGEIRHDLRRGPQPAYVDSERSHLNRVLIEPATTSELRKICQERRALRDTSRAMKSNAAIMSRGIITFGAEAAQMFETLTPEQQDACFREVAQAVADRLATSLHALVVHLDEATIHAHYQLAAYNKFGDPVSKSTSPRVMSELQDILAEIMQKYHPDIERGNRYGDRLAAGADWSDVIHKSVKELHRTLPADLAKKREALAALVQAETDAAARVDEMQARVDKLAEKTDLSEKEVKRLATYEKRLADRVKELEEAQAASEAAKIEADRLAALARTDRQDEEAKAEKIRAKADAVTDAVASLAEEVSARTIRRTPEGGVTAAHPERLKPAFPEIRPAVAAAADLVTGMDAVRSDLAAEQVELEEGRRDLMDGQMQLMTAAAEIQSLRQKLKQALSMVVGWLRRPDLPADLRGDGQELLKGSRQLLSTEKPGEDSGPGF